MTRTHLGFWALALALCLFLLDDAIISRVLRVPSPPAATTPAPRDRALRCFAPFIGALAVFQISSLIIAPLRALPVVSQVSVLAAPYRIVNGYGLFAVMTTRRGEIVLEGSDDGERWEAYEFTAKPGNVKRAPPWVAPFQPRLDWQMWFAALGEPERSPWLSALILRLLQGSAPVERLFARVPFDHPPKYMRAVLYDYRFTGLRERSLDGAWWKRELRGEFIPPVSLR